MDHPLLHEKGFTCLAWEESEEYRYFLARLRRAGKKNFRFLQGTPGERDEILATYFQAVLALNIVDHPEGMTFNPIELLKKIHGREFFLLQPAHRDLYLHQGANEDASLAPMEFLRDFPSPKKWVSIGALADGSTVYKWSDK